MQASGATSIKAGGLDVDSGGLRVGSGGVAVTSGGLTVDGGIHLRTGTFTIDDGVDGTSEGRGFEVRSKHGHPKHSMTTFEGIDFFENHCSQRRVVGKQQRKAALDSIQPQTCVSALIPYAVRAIALRGMIPPAKLEMQVLAGGIRASSSDASTTALAAAAAGQGFGGTVLSVAALNTSPSSSFRLLQARSSRL